MRPPKGHVAMLSLVHVSFYLLLISLGQKFCRKMPHKRKKKSEKFLYFLILAKLIDEFSIKSSKFKILTSKEKGCVKTAFNFDDTHNHFSCDNDAFGCLLSLKFFISIQDFLIFDPTDNKHKSEPFSCPTRGSLMKMMS